LHINSHILHINEYILRTDARVLQGHCNALLSYAASTHEGAAAIYLAASSRCIQKDNIFILQGNSPVKLSYCHTLNRHAKGAALQSLLLATSITIDTIQ
jgi:hypothetical protein